MQLRKQHLDYLIDRSFQGVNRRFCFIVRKLMQTEQVAGNIFFQV